MKMLIVFIAAIMLFGSLKKPDCNYNPKLVSLYYRNGKMIYIQQNNSTGFHLSGLLVKLYVNNTGKIIQYDSVSIVIQK